MLKCGNYEFLKQWNSEIMAELGWKYIEMAGIFLKIAGNGWNWTLFVPFWPLVLNMTEFDDDDDYESNGMAYIPVLNYLFL